MQPPVVPLLRFELSASKQRDEAIGLEVQGFARAIRYLKCSKFKVALNPMYRIFLNFAKSCVLSCLSKVDNIKKIHRVVFEL